MIQRHLPLSLSAEVNWNLLSGSSFRSEKYKLLYVATPKVACTTLKWWFAALEGCSQALHQVTDSIETDPDLIIHDSFSKIAPNVTCLSPETLLEILTSDFYFRFALVRNPYKRIFSAWQSKLLLREPYQIGPYLQYDFLHRPIECAEDIAVAFEDFLKHLAVNEAPSYWNIHWTPQAVLLRPDLINYSKLVKIENAKELSRALAERLGAHIPDPFAARRTNESLIPYLPELLTERSSELIHSLYAVDFETFGYSKQPPEVKETYSTDQFNLAFKAIALIRGRHRRFHEVRSSLNEQLNGLSQALAERDGQIQRLKQAIVERDNQIAILNQVVADREGKIANLIQAIVEHGGQIASLKQTMPERDEQISEFNQAVTSAIAEKANLVEQNQALIRGNIVLNSELANIRHQHHLAQLRIQNICSSRSWRLIKPLRFVSRITKGVLLGCNYKYLAYKSKFGRLYASLRYRGIYKGLAHLIHVIFNRCLYKLGRK